MKIEVAKWIFDDNASYKILHIENCCSKLTNSENIELNNEPDEHEYCINDKIAYSVKLVRAERSYDSDYEDFYYEKIDFCPFCGESIEIKVVEEIDKTEEYKLLKNKRDTLWDKCRNTDSKKKALELSAQVSGLDKKINAMWESDGF